MINKKNRPLYYIEVRHGEIVTELYTQVENATVFAHFKGYKEWDDPEVQKIVKRFRLGKATKR